MSTTSTPDDAPDSPEENQTLEDYIQNNRAAVEDIADSDLPASEFFERLLTRTQEDSS